MEETISLQELFDIIKKRFALILTAMFLGLGVSAVVTFVLMTPKYSSSTQLMVKLPRPAEGVNSNVNDVNFNLYMITTYKDFITTSNIVADMAAETVVKETNFKGNAKDIQEMIEVVQEQNSQMFSVKATSTDPKVAQVVANTVAKVFQEQAKEVIEVDKISIIAPANLNTSPISPNNKLNLFIGLVLGLMVGIGFAFLLELVDKTVKDGKFINEVLEFPILGTVPEMTAKELSGKVIQQPVESTNLRSQATLTDNMDATERVPSQARRQRNRL